MPTISALPVSLVCRAQGGEDEGAGGGAGVLVARAAGTEIAGPALAGHHRNRGVPAGLLEDPALSVSVVCRFVGGAVNLAQSVQDSVQTRRSLFTAFKWLLLLIGSRAPESGVYHRVVWAVFVISTLAFIASWFSITIPDFRCAWVAGATAGQPAIFARAKAGHKAC